MMNQEQVSSYTIEDFYNTPTPPDKALIGAKFLGQDLARIVQEMLNDDIFFEVIHQLKE